MNINLQLFGGRGGSSGGGGGGYGEITQETYQTLYGHNGLLNNGSLNNAIARALEDMINGLNNVPIKGNGVNNWQFGNDEVQITNELRGLAHKYPDRLSVDETLGLDNVNVKDFNGLVSDIKRDTSKGKRKRK